MKRYIYAANKDIDSMWPTYKKDFQNNKEKFLEVLGLDPTARIDKQRGGKYGPWLIKQFKAGNIPEEFYGQEQNSLTDALTDFSRNSSRFAHTDIGQYQTVDELLTNVREVNSAPLTPEQQKKANKKAAHNAGDKDKKLLATHGSWELWQPLTWAGSQSLARWGGTVAQWCTAYTGNDNWYRNYTSKGPLFIFINTAKKDGSEKYQQHFESNSWMYNIHDHSQGGKAFYEQFISDKPEFQEALDYHIINGCSIRAGNLIGISETAEVVDMSDLPVTVETIAPNLFSNKSNIKRVVLPPTLTTIGDNTFSGCSGLESVSIPNGVTSLGTGAFTSCTSLKAIALPDSVETIGDNCFAYCTNLSKVRLSANLATIGNSAFFSNMALTSIAFPAGLIRIGNNAFINCTGLTAVKLPKSLKEIGANAFLRCMSLTDVQIPKGMTKVGAGIFRACPNLSEAAKASITAASEHYGKPLM